MTAKLEFFPVDNGDMTLLTLESGRMILIDINIREAADEEDDETPDVAELLRKRLERDSSGRLYVDAFLLSHPDADHCRGLERHFHLGPPAAWSKKDDKILVREMWSSPIVFRRSSELDGDLCADADEWWAEARRRVQAFRDAKKAGKTVVDGDRILILGEDIDEKTKGLEDIRVDIDQEITRICGIKDGTFAGLLLAPLPPSNDKEEEEALKKNHSSVVVRFKITGDKNNDAARFLTGGDAEVAIWEKLWGRHKKTADNLTYDILLTPHHCSWHSLSYESWSGSKGKAKVAQDARSALANAKNKAFLISSSKEIKDDDCDPPCIGAKREYEGIASGVNGSFLCTAEECGDDVLAFEIGSNGPARGTTKGSAGGGSAMKGGGAKQNPQMTEKVGGGRYA